jgi:glycerol-3-phosphate dehydrogenase
MFRNWEVGWHECVAQASRKVPRFISICIGYPGVSAAPAAAREVTELLRREGLRLETNERFSPIRKAPPVFNELPEEEQEELIAKTSRYGHVVCRCETVSEGEIIEAIRRGATTLDGVKFRTRASMGRCQGGFCTPRVVKILARELGLPEQKITKKGRESHLLLYKSKELIEAQG